MGLGHFFLFLVFYVFGLIYTNSQALIFVRLGWFFAFMVFACRAYFEVPVLAHRMTLLTLVGILTVSNVVDTGCDYAFNTFYDDQHRYVRGRAQIEKINERRDRRNLPHEFFDKAKVDAAHHPRQYFYNMLTGLVVNTIVVLLIYPLGLFYWHIRKE